MVLQDPSSSKYGGRQAEEEFLLAGGPSVIRYRLDSMEGEDDSDDDDDGNDDDDDDHRIRRLDGGSEKRHNRSARSDREASGGSKNLRRSRRNQGAASHAGLPRVARAGPLSWTLWTCAFSQR